MIIEIEFDYGRKFTQEEQDHLKKNAISRVGFSDDTSLDYTSRHIIIPFVAAAFFDKFQVTRSVKAPGLEHFGHQPGTVINQRCSVSVPGLGLLAIGEVMVRNDHCTEELQKDLENGWRILAICVQPDQRRPDYILGRTKE